LNSACALCWHFTFFQDIEQKIIDLESSFYQSLQNSSQLTGKLSQISHFNLLHSVDSDIQNESIIQINQITTSDSAHVEVTKQLDGKLSNASEQPKTSKLQQMLSSSSLSNKFSSALFEHGSNPPKVLDFASSSELDMTGKPINADTVPPASHLQESQSSSSKITSKLAIGTDSVHVLKQTEWTSDSPNAYRSLTDVSNQSSQRAACLLQSRSILRELQPPHGEGKHTAACRSQYWNGSELCDDLCVSIV
jgi:hypothetical protein